MTARHGDELARAVREAEPVAPEPPRPLRRELPPAEPYPLAALGQVLAPAAEAIRDIVQAPDAICAQAVLGAAALAIQGHADVLLPTEQPRPCSLYLITVAESGERKTSADREALWPVRRREEALREQHSHDRLRYKNDRDLYEQRRKEILAEAKNGSNNVQEELAALGAPPVPPAQPMLTVTEPTLEGLHRYFAGGLPSLGLFSAEGGQMLGGYGMSPDHRLKTAAGLSALWDGEPIRRMRAGDGAVLLPGRRLSVHLMVQPGVAAGLLADHRLADQGLLSRLLSARPDSVAGSRRWREPAPGSHAALDRYGRWLLAIFERPLPYRDPADRALDPRRLPLRAEAKRLWIAFHNHVESRLGPGGELEPIRAFAAKLAEHAARIAAVLALVADLDAGEVTADSMAAGIELAQFYAGEALRMFEAGAISPDILLAERTLAWLGGWSEPVVSLPDLYQLGPNGIRTAAEARRIVEVLVGHGWLLPLDGVVTVRGVPRREAWRIVRGG